MPPQFYERREYFNIHSKYRVVSYKKLFKDEPDLQQCRLRAVLQHDYKIYTNFQRFHIKVDEVVLSKEIKGANVYICPSL